MGSSVSCSGHCGARPSTRIVPESSLARRSASATEAELGVASWHAFADGGQRARPRRDRGRGGESSGERRAGAHGGRARGAPVQRGEGREHAHRAGADRQDRPRGQRERAGGGGRGRARRGRALRERGEPQGPAPPPALDAPVEVGAQLLERLLQARAQRARRHAEVRRGGARVEPLEVAQHDDRAQRLGEARDGLGQQALGFRLLRQRARLRALPLLVREALARLAPRAVAARVAREVAHDAREPGARFPLQAGRSAQGGDPRVLQQVLGLRALAHQTRGEAPQPAGLAQQLLDLGCPLHAVPAFRMLSHHGRARCRRNPSRARFDASLARPRRDQPRKRAAAVSLARRRRASQSKAVPAR